MYEKLSDIIVVKRDNSKENFKPEKIYQHINQACEGITGVNPGDILNNLRIKMKSKMKSSEIQQMLVLSAQELISEETPNYDYVAARLLNQDVRKQVYGQYEPIFNVDVIKQRIKKGYYSNEIFDFYTEDEIEDLIKVINWKKDDNFTYLGLVQTSKKYAIKRNGKPIETPQEMFFLIPLYNFAEAYQHNPKQRADLVKRYYKALSDFKLILSTPPMNGMRTVMKGYTSCAGLDLGDSIESIGNASKDMFKLITKLRAGIGINAGKIRGLGADIADGLEEHTGITPYLKVYEKISKSSQQPNSGRSGAVTFDYPFFHWEIENILQLKNNKGTEETRVRQSDHSITFNELFYERYKNNESITLFHMNDVGDLYERIGEPEYFKQKYEELEQKRGVQKRTVSAKSIYDTYWNERFGNGRMYKLNAEAMNQHSAFKLPVYTSNLCREIALPHYPNEDIRFDCNLESQKQVQEHIERLYEIGGEDGWYSLYSYLYYGTEPSEDVKELLPGLKKNKKGKFKFNFGETFSCILGGINFNIQKEEFEELMDLQVRFLDAMIDVQDYAGIETFEKFSKNRRALGISPSNLFYLLAKHDADYNSLKAKEIVSEYMEYMLFYGLKASMELAKEKGRCRYFNDTKYSDGITPLDTYNKNVDLLVKDKRYIPKNEWDTLKEDIKKYGMRNSTILTAVPASNSSRVSNSISGINPPQSLITTIEDKKVNIKSALPNLRKYKKFYERNSAWVVDTVEYTKLVAVIQKYIDQGISLNSYYDLTNEEKYKNGKITMGEIIKLDAVVHKYGIKSLYYNKTRTQSKDVEQNEIKDEQACSGGGCEL